MYTVTQNVYIHQEQIFFFFSEIMRLIPSD